MKVQLSCGEVELRKPIGRAMQKAMEEAEIGDGKFKITVLFRVLMPYCIASHPWGMTPITKAIEGLPGEDYMKLFNSMKEMMPFKGDEAGELKERCTQTDSPETSD